MSQISLLIINAAEVVTAASPGGPLLGSAMNDAHVISQGFVAVGPDGLIVEVGTMADLSLGAAAQATLVIDASRRAVLPGFVDAHTHIVYGGDRTHEFKLRIAGAGYVAIAQAGGGILSSMRATRTASQEHLVQSAVRRLDRMLLTGTTTAETKSGYGLSLADELKQLAAIRMLDRTHPVDLIPTFMGAHEIPPEYRDDPEVLRSLDNRGNAASGGPVRAGPF